MRKPGKSVDNMSGGSDFPSRIHAAGVARRKIAPPDCQGFELCQQPRGPVLYGTGPYPFAPLSRKGWGKSMDLFTRRPAGAVKILLIIHAVLLFAGLYAHLWIYRLYSEMPELYWHLPHSARDFQQFAVLAQLGSFFITSTFFLLWAYRSYRNLSALSDRDLRFSPGWAVSWYFVPIMNLFRPFQVMKEIWKGSDPDADPSRPEEGKGRTGSPLLQGWWGLWLLNNLLAGVPVSSPWIRGNRLFPYP